MPKYSYLANNAAIIIDRTGKILDVSIAFSEKIGYERSSLINARISELVEDSSSLQKVLAEGGELPISAIDGVFYPVYFTKEGDFLVGYDLDSIAKAIKQMYAGVWDFYYFLIFVDEKGRIITANDTFCKAAGISNIEGRKIEEVFLENAAQLTEVLKKGEDEISLKINGKEFRIRVRVRKIEVLGKALYEILAMTTADRIRDESLRLLENELLKYKLSFESSVDAIIITDLNAKILHANSAVNFYGYTPKELIGRSIFDFVYPEHLENAEKAIEEGKKTGGFKRLELRIKDKFGNFRWVEAVGSAIREKDGSISGAILILRDITAKKDLERRLRESEELYRTLVENSNSGIYIIQDGELVYMNRATQNYVGYSPEELRRDWKKVFDREIWDKIDKVHEEVLGGRVVQTFAKYRTKGGEERYASFVLSPITFMGRPAILGNFIDVTSSVVSEKKLREREELYRSLTEYSHTGIFIIQNDKIVYANERLRDITGYSLEEINSLEHPYKILHPDFFEKVLSIYRAREKGETMPSSYEVKIITKDGRERWLKVLANRIIYKGRPAVMANVADITDLKETESMLRRVNLLLKAASDCSREITKEKTEFRILASIKKHLEKIGLKVAAYINDVELIPVSISGDVDDSVQRAAEKYLSYDEVGVEKIGENFALFIPLSNGRVRAVVAILSEREFTEEEMSILRALGRDVSYALSSIQTERLREAAMNVIMDNLSQFENLADRLRNPLAIIKGYIEVRRAFSYDDFAKKIEEQAERIERILDELRAREIATYEMKKILEGRNF